MSIQSYKREQEKKIAECEKNIISLIEEIYELDAEHRNILFNNCINSILITDFLILLGRHIVKS